VLICTAVLLLTAACGGGDGGSSDSASSATEPATDTSVDTTAPDATEPPTTLPAGQTPGQDDLNQDGMPDPICSTTDFGGGLVLRVPCIGKDYAPDPLEGTTPAPNSLLSLPAIQQRELLSEASADGVQGRDPTGKMVYVFYIQSDVLFETGAAALTVPAQASIEGLARSIQRVAPNSAVQVRGHTDATGSASVNQTLSEQRAANVATALGTQGIAQSRLTSVGFASTRPLVLETNPDGSPNVQGRTQNRRVEMVVRLP
jgi:outer membrane protein OmpA-like peptidoglycan-associated protein